MAGVDRFGRLKKNPLLGQAFGASPEGEARRESYMGLHRELKDRVTSGRRGSLADVAKKRFRRWGDPRAADINQRQGEAARLQSGLGRMSFEHAETENEITDLWGKRRRMEVLGQDFSDVMLQRSKLQKRNADLAGTINRNQSTFAGHNAAINAGRGAYQAQQGLYNQFFGRGGY